MAEDAPPAPMDAPPVALDAPAVALDAPAVALDAAPPPADAGPSCVDDFAGPRDVDLLFLIGNTISMASFQGMLAGELPRIVQALATGDADDDGTPDFDPVGSLHIGVVSGDMGAGPYTYGAYCRLGLGGDGLLHASDGYGTVCQTSGSAIFDFQPGVTDVDALERGLNCVTDVGTSGCGYEHQLEAPLKALTPSDARDWTASGYAPPRFLDATGTADAEPGHGDFSSDGFLRPNSVLAVVVFSNADDCSLASYDLISPSDPDVAATPEVLRCSTYADPAAGYLYPVERYVDGLVGLRQNPHALVFSAIVGIPEDAEPDAADGDFAAVLARPEMVQRPNDDGDRLEPSCSNDRDNSAEPPVRIVQAASGLAARGASVSLFSICGDNFQSPLEHIVQRIGAAPSAACLDEPTP